MAKPFAVLLLLLGMWGAELALFGLWWAGFAAIAMWCACAAVLIATRAPEHEPATTRQRTVAGRGAHALS
jgi:hypothetical protein